MRNEMVIYPDYQFINKKNDNIIYEVNAKNLAQLPEILFITSFAPRKCGIATYSQDLIKYLNDKFHNSFKLSICPIESENENYIYPSEIKHILNTDYSNSFDSLITTINDNPNLLMVVIQHEFGFFEKREEDFISFLDSLTKPVIMVFHTILPQPNSLLKAKVKRISDLSESIIVMTNSSAKILITDYAISQEKITIIPHGTHLVPHSDKELLKYKYNLAGKKILATFGLLSSGKSIETTLQALPSIIEAHPDVLFLIIGKTHPSIIKQEGEKYRQMLEAKVNELQLHRYVKFINYFLPLSELLEYLQLTDIYLFTSKDPNQAVSGTFSYASSCGCPIISTPIPHAREVLKNDVGMIIDFENPPQLAQSAITLLSDENLRKNISLNELHKMAATAWENTAIAYARLFEIISNKQISLHYTLPAINLYHFKHLSTNFGMIQFAKINHPDINSGYTLDDNARAMIAMCQYFELTKDQNDLKNIEFYFNFIKFCLQPEGYFLNYVDKQKNFTEQNNQINLADSNGRAIWALGYMISISHLLPKELIKDTKFILQIALLNIDKIHSTRAMAFIIKGLYYCNLSNESVYYKSLIRELANRLVQMYAHEATEKWHWFENYLTYANSILPEAMLCAWRATQERVYREIAESSFDFLLSKTFKNNLIKVVSNQGWLYKEQKMSSKKLGGEQPIDVAYTILALSNFHEEFPEKNYDAKLGIAFNWFLGNNHLNQIIYNPCTGGCYDGLEENYVNLNQGAESTVSYLMARLTMEKYLKNEKINNSEKYHFKINR